MSERQSAQQPMPTRAQRKELDLQSSVLMAPTDAALGETVALLGRARAGDAHARNELALRYADRLHTFVRMKLHGRSLGKETEDIVNDSYLQLFRRLDQFEYRGKDSVYAYLVRIALNYLQTPASRTAVARGGDDNELFLEQVLGGEATPSQAQSQAELRAILEETLCELPADMRQAIEYRHILGVPSKLAAYWMEIDDAAKFDHLVNRAKMRWLKLAEPRLAEWRNRD
jgi:hypothetical protein